MITETTSAKTIAIKHICNHTTTVEIDRSVSGWVKHYKQQVCFTCQPTESITRLCGHTEDVARGFYSPRAAEASAMQLCSQCRPAGM